VTGPGPGGLRRLPGRAEFVVAVDHSSDGRLVISVSGELELAIAPTLRAVILDPVLPTWSELVIDPRAVTFMDSTGIGALVAARRHALQNGGSLVVRCIDGSVSKVLDSRNRVTETSQPHDRKRHCPRCVVHGSVHIAAQRHLKSGQGRAFLYRLSVSLGVVRECRAAANSEVRR
jgi:anti-sigma B factor antagonist